MCKTKKTDSADGARQKRTDSSFAPVAGRRLFDSNAAAKEGAFVVGRFSRKYVEKKCMKVEFFVGTKKCSGALHVSQFPHNEREVRDKMFEIAQPGPQTFRMKIIRVIPPSGERRLTGIHLSTLDLD